MTSTKRYKKQYDESDWGIMIFFLIIFGSLMFGLLMGAKQVFIK